MARGGMCSSLSFRASVLAFFFSTQGDAEALPAEVASADPSLPTTMSVVAAPQAKDSMKSTADEVPSEQPPGNSSSSATLHAPGISNPQGAMPAAAGTASQAQPPPTMSQESEAIAAVPRAGSIAAARWMLSLDHISMLGAWFVKHTDENDVEISESGTQAALVGGGVTTGASVLINPHAVPRLALDRKIGSNFTIGLGASLYTQSGSWDAERANQTASGDGETSWLVSASPRIGYLIPVGDSAAVWPRVGVSWSQQRMHNAAVRNYDVKLATVDFALSWIYGVFEHFGAVATIDVCLPLSGIRHLDYDPSFATRMGVAAHQEQNLGLGVIALQFGILAYF